MTWMIVAISTLIGKSLLGMLWCVQLGPLVVCIQLEFASYGSEFQILFT